MSVHPERTYVVTGADSGIGALTARTLQERGARVIRCGLGVDVEVSADLGDDEGRAHLLREVERLAPGGIDGLALVAGLGTPTVETVRVNYFGTLSVLAGLRTRLRKKEAPRVVVVSSASSLTAGDPEVIEACLRGDEEAAVAAAAEAPEAVILNPGDEVTVHFSASSAEDTLVPLTGIEITSRAPLDADEPAAP